MGVRVAGYLEKRRQGYFAVRDVPPSLREAVGRIRFRKGLGTRDVHLAKARLLPALLGFEKAIRDSARRQPAADPLRAEALEMRKETLKLRSGDAGGSWAEPEWHQDDDTGEWHRGSVAEAVLGIHEDHIRDRAEAIGRQEGPQRAEAFATVALACGTPLGLHVDAWLAEGGAKGPLRQRTKDQYRADLTRFEAWAAEASIAPTVEAITKGVAGRFVAGLVKQAMDRNTANRKLSTLSSYWRWMLKRGHVELNPWTGQSLTRGPQGDAEKVKRPFTDAEALTLLTGDADPELHDAMRAAALTGMRVGELYRLTVADCGGGLFRIRQSKTRAGVRRVPIHPDLSALVARRVAKKALGDYLFHEGPPERPGRERSMVIVKRFVTYRRRVGVDETTEGRRHGHVDFHSWRRRFVTEARNAGVDRATVAAVVGHEAGNLTDDTYSGGPSMALMRACVEAVRLPSVPHGGPDAREGQPKAE